LGKVGNRDFTIVVVLGSRNKLYLRPRVPNFVEDGASDWFHSSIEIKIGRDVGLKNWTLACVGGRSGMEGQHEREN